ncbi:unnamed protein product [Paramecium primaurelia]|uniref:Uncharacterized protein n=1 Tax=Paramecium primaurelia TaxID=5886 RepID=A0A8S1LYP0_PARPR|nr:unnamed protein product [Paramecium primaurelia]
MSNSPSNKRKFKLKYEVVTPGMYFDDSVNKIVSHKRRVSSQSKIQPSILENYEYKVKNVFEKQLQETEKLHNKVKPQKDQLTKKELIEKLVTQMQDHLQQKEKELFETSNIDDHKRLERRKSIFYQEQSHLAMLQQMKERFASQQETKKQIDRKKIKHSSDSSPMRGTRKKTNLECQLYEQEQIEYGLQEYYKLQRIKKNVEKQLNRMGLIDLSVPDQRVHSRKLSLLQNSSQLIHNSILTQEKSKSKSNPKTHNTNNILKRIKEKIQHVHTNYSNNNSMSTLITCCDQEIAQLKRMDNDINKKKKIQIKKFRVIQSDLDAIGFMRFQRAKIQ